MPRAYRFRPPEATGNTIDYTELPPSASGVAPGPAYPSSRPIPPSGDVYGTPRVPYTPPAATPAPNLSNAPMVTADQYLYQGDVVPQYAAASRATTITNPDYTMPYPLPGGFARPTSSFDPATGQNWMGNAVTGQPSSPNLVGPENQPLPAVQQLLFGNNQRQSMFDPNALAPDWASSARGTFGRGPNYVDPRSANAFIDALVNWNAGGWSANPTGGEQGRAVFGRGPTTAQGLARASVLRGGGSGGGIQGIGAKIT